MEGDEEEDDIDDVDNEFNFEGRGVVLHAHSDSRFFHSDLPSQVLHNTSPTQPHLLTNDHMVTMTTIATTLSLSQ